MSKYIVHHTDQYGRDYVVEEHEHKDDGLHYDLGFIVRTNVLRLELIDRDWVYQRLENLKYRRRDTEITSEKWYRGFADWNDRRFSLKARRVGMLHKKALRLAELEYGGNPWK